MMDARSLTLFLRGRTHNNMLDRMSLMIASYQAKITWLKGMDNKISDMISRMPMVTNDTRLIPRHDWLKVQNSNLPSILESCSTPQKGILCKSKGLIGVTPSDGKIRLNSRPTIREGARDSTAKENETVKAKSGRDGQ